MAIILMTRAALLNRHMASDVCSLDCRGTRGSPDLLPRAPSEYEADVFPASERGNQPSDGGAQALPQKFSSLTLFDFAGRGIADA